MLKNYFRLAVRSLVKNKFFSFINVFGLAMGIACCMFIAAYVHGELSFDSYPENAANIYRVQVNVTGNGAVETYPNVDIAVGEGMKNTFPEVKSYSRLLALRASYVKYGDKQFKEQKLAGVDPNFLLFFSIRCIEGDIKTCLSGPGNIVITRGFAKKYFGQENPMGKTLTIGITLYKVTGIIEKVPDNSHFHFDAFLSMSFPPQTPQTWSNVGFYTYLLLEKNADPKKLESTFPSLVAKYVVPEVKRDMGVSLAEAQKSVNTFKFFLQPLKRIHLFSNTKYELEANGDIQYVYIFSALAIFILLLACVNFTNLSTASASKRAREVGIRKVMGSQKKQLVIQFLAESILQAYCAICLAFIIMYALMPYFNQLAGMHVNLLFFLSGLPLISVLFFGLLVGIFAGLYPAFFLSSFNTINTLKGISPTTSKNKNLLRSTLVVFQFTVSTTLIIATFVVSRQLHFMQNKKLGYDKEQVLFLQDTYVLGNRDMQNALKQAILKDSRVISASTGADVPGNTDMDGTQVYAKDRIANENDAEIHTNIFHVDYDYIPTLGISVINGRNFSRGFSTDSFAVIINEAAVRDLGWTGTNVIGKTIVTSGQHEHKVIGVVADFHYASVKQKIAPLMLEIGSVYRSGLFIKIRTTDISNLLAGIKKQWRDFNPGAPFAYYFLDEKFNSLYTTEKKTGQIFTVFAIVAIIIACLGLFGLATFTASQRTKEIGIRKVLGASIAGIISMLTTDFLKLVCLALMVATPVAWIGMSHWLQDFAYRINIPWQAFVFAAIGAMAITLVTISFQAIKSALANPVKSLRTE